MNGVYRSADMVTVQNQHQRFLPYDVFNPANFYLRSLAERDLSDIAEAEARFHGSKLLQVWLVKCTGMIQRFWVLLYGSVPYAVRAPHEGGLIHYCRVHHLLFLMAFTNRSCNNNSLPDWPVQDQLHCSLDRVHFCLRPLVSLRRDPGLTAA